MTTLAIVQCAIAADVHANGRTIRSAMRRAAEAGARLVQFPEGALSGYVKSEIMGWDAVDWGALEAELAEVAALAGQLGVWVVLGANHPLPAQDGAQARPQNCLHVLSDTGQPVARYAKRLCSHTELASWYTPGTDPTVFDVDGMRFGCALCIEVVFPHLFDEYERLGVDCMLLSSYSQDPIHGVMARAHAATNGFWVGLSTPVACSRFLPTALYGPDGAVLETGAAGEPTILLHRLDRTEPRYHVALALARPWRAAVRAVPLHANRLVMPVVPPEDELAAAVPAAIR